MDISISAVIAQTLNFLVLFFLFRKYLTRPIVNIIEDRRDLIKKVENADQAYKKKLKEAEEQSSQIIQEWKKRKEDIIVEAWLLADRKQNEIIGYAKDQAEKIIKDANIKSESIQRELESKFEDSVKSTSLLVLKKLINKEKEIQDEYVSEAIQELQK